ncbi:MAG TPA: hypothetical protein VGA08_02290 [Candidatus Saccharimonadales bacterium]
MGRRKINKQYIRKIGKIGSQKNHSYYVTLPVAYIRSLGWREGQKIVVKKVGAKVSLLDWQQ